MASPPGKKLQTLSLLSGGEQALTALALLFAVFLTNPAPICVLDEVDAPLDDANVDRFCTLLEHIGASTGTRFVIVTHHRMTMARMDRLFGVTMAERGVSPARLGRPRRRRAHARDGLRDLGARLLRLAWRLGTRCAWFSTLGGNREWRRFRMRFHVVSAAVSALTPPAPARTVRAAWARASGPRAGRMRNA